MKWCPWQWNHAFTSNPNLCVMGATKKKMILLLRSIGYLNEEMLEWFRLSLTTCYTLQNDHSSPSVGLTPCWLVQTPSRSCSLGGPWFTSRLRPAGRLSICDWSTVPRRMQERGAGEQHGTEWITGVKWRCLKEQRRKFAITMTVNIQVVRRSLSVDLGSIEDE